MPKKFRIGFGVALLGVALGQSAAGAGCNMTKIAELPTELESGTRILIKGGINGKEAVFLLDTGATETIFDYAVVPEFGVREGPKDIRLTGVGGESMAFRSTIPNLQLGDHNAGNLPMMVSETHFLSGNVYALLGDDFLGLFDLDIDIKNNKINLFEYNDCRSEPVYWSDKFSEAEIQTRDRQILVSVQINGLPALALLDTGASRSVVSVELIKRLGIDPDILTAHPVQKAHGIDKHILELHPFRFDTVAVGDETVKNVSLSVGEFSKRKFEHSSASRLQNLVPTEYDMILGADFIRNHHIYVATRRLKMYFTWNGGSVFQQPPAHPAEESQSPR